MSTIYKKENIIFGALLILLSILLFLPFFVSAQETFVPLTNGGIPGVQAGSSFGDFLNTTFKLGLAVAATLAVVMITIGGLQYMTTDSIYNKTEGREKIQDAIIGLLIALLIWLILFTINPNLLKFDINIKGVKSGQNKFENSQTNQKSNKGGGTLNTSPFNTKASNDTKPGDVVDPGAPGA